MRFDPAAAPPQLAAGSFLSITRTENELSIVCAEEHATGFEADREGMAGVACSRSHSVHSNRPARVDRKAARCGGHPDRRLSTFDTDYILVKEERLEERKRFSRCALPNFLSSADRKSSPSVNESVPAS